MKKPKIIRVFSIHSHGCGSDNTARYDTDVIIRVQGTKTFGDDNDGIRIMNKLKKLSMFKGVRFVSE